MPADEHASALIDGWSDTQRRMWDAWADAARSTNTDDDATAAWRDAVASALKAWANEALPLARATTEWMAKGSERLAETIELSMRAWRALVPADGDWSSVASQFVDQFSALLLGGPLSQLGELWRLSLDEIAGLQRAWFEEFVDGPRPTDGHGASEPTVLRTFTDRYWDTWERTFGRLLESPNVGQTREISLKSTEAMRAWLHFRRAATEYQFVLADALGRSWSAFLEEFVARVEQGETPQSSGDVLRLWGKTTDRVLTEAFGTESYGRAQAQLLNAAMAYRRAEREVVDKFLQTSHIPSRSELDEANRSIFELKRQVRDLQKTVQHLAATPRPAEKADAEKATKATKATKGPRKGLS